MLVERKHNRKLYAIKLLRKVELSKHLNMVKRIMTEREVLKQSKSPFVLKLRFSFMDDSTLYFGVDYVPGGNLFQLMSRKPNEKFSLDEARFYAAEILLGLEHLHETLNTVHRDLKLDNILIDSNGHIKIADFGLSKSSITF